MFQISSLRRDDFEQLFALDEAALARLGARRCVVDKKPGFPCRVSLEDAEPGEQVVLLPYDHQPAGSPYRASGPIFVREAARTVSLPVDTVPELLRTRLLSVRAYDDRHVMTGAEVIDGPQLEQALTRALDSDRVSYLHIHFAGPGCYACRVDRAS
jgi:uncharacterized protein DUF1203